MKIKHQLCLSFLSIATLFVVGCTDNKELSSLQSQIDNLTNTQIASVNLQIANIQKSIGDLTDVQKELRTLISDLRKDLEDWEGEVDAKYAEVERRLKALEDADAALDQKIKDLKTYCDTQIENTKDWASATFATLEQHQAVISEIALIKTQHGELTTALTNLDSQLSQKITDAEGRLNAAIATSENSIKEWVNSKLSGYYTIAQSDALLSSLEGSLSERLEAQKAELNALINGNQSSIESHAASIDSLRNRIIQLEADIAGLATIREELNTAKSEITTAYQAAIKEAIENSEGKLSGQITEGVTTINARIDNVVSEINEALTALSNRVTQCETDIQSLRDEINGVKADITKLLARIQSVTYVPRYSDGRARVFFDKDGDNISAEPLSLDFEVHPNSLAADLAAVWMKAITLKAVSTITTKADPSFVNLNIVSLVANGGILSLQVEATSLPATFFNGEKSINACLCVSDGTNDLVSEYVPILAINRNISVATLPATNVITGTATLNGSIQYSGEITPTEIGYYYGSSSEDLSNNGTKVTSELKTDGTFSSVLTNLDDGTTYYVAYAIVGSKAYYGEIRNFAILTTIEVGGAVDLGLSVLWATCNVGGEYPEDYGNYYAWGETGLKESYTYWNYKWAIKDPYGSGGSEDNVFLEKYNIDGSIGVVDNLVRLLPEDDVAHKKLGGKWRMPTEAEWRELIKECNWSQTTVNNYLGLVAERNGKCIFLPLAGSRRSDLQYYQGGEGDYWSADLCVENPKLAISCYFEQGPSHFTTGYYSRSHGYSVRPVYDPNYALVSSITLDKTTISLKKGSSATITATINPTGATYKSLLWTSSDESVAKVNAYGKVTSIADGDATIIATASDGSGIHASCAVHVTTPTPPEGAVDLGLSVYWASCNVGATKPEEYGDHFAWGETSAKGTYYWSNYLLCDGEHNLLNKYNYDESYGVVDNKYVLEPEDDVAHVRLGGKWRIPTSDECEELIDLCASIWTTENGVSGRRFTGPNGNSIFLPAAGYRYAFDPIHNEGDRGCYWTSAKGTYSPMTAVELVMTSSSVSVANQHPRLEGLTVRPVSD